MWGVQGWMFAVAALVPTTSCSTSNCSDTSWHSHHSHRGLAVVDSFVGVAIGYVLLYYHAQCSAMSSILKFLRDAKLESARATPRRDQRDDEFRLSCGIGCRRSTSIRISDTNEKARKK